MSVRWHSGRYPTFDSSNTALRTESMYRLRRQGHIQIPIRLCISIGDTLFRFKISMVSSCSRTKYSGRAAMNPSESRITPYDRCNRVTPSGFFCLHFQLKSSQSCSNAPCRAVYLSLACSDFIYVVDVWDSPSI